MSTFFKKFTSPMGLTKRSKRSNHKNSRKSLGFTMIEILVVMIMVGVLSAIAAPSWLSFVNTQRLNGSQTKVFQAIKSAQSEAKQRQTSNITRGLDSNNQVVDINRRVKLTLNTNSFRLDNVAIESGKNQPLEEGVVISSVTGIVPNPPFIEFDSKGFLYDPNRTNLSLPICINLKLENAPKVKWIKIQTLLGAVTTGDNACP